jgi:aspartate/methionine/tyrosine aminotransferase
VATNRANAGQGTIADTVVLPARIKGYNSQCSNTHRSALQAIQAVHRHGEPMNLDTMNHDQLRAHLSQLEDEYAAHKAAGLKLDLTRGKPSTAQVDLSAALDGALDGDFSASDGSDTRNYGGLDGLPETKSMGAQLMGLSPEQVIVGGNSSLTLMYLYIMHCMHFGPGVGGGPWRDNAAGVRFLCPVPGYDRHFTICEEFGIEMINIPMTDDGPDMDQVESLLASDPSIKGMWCVPKYSNPSGEIYSAQTVRRIAALARTAAPGFQVMWDNAYAVHDLNEEHALTDIMPIAEQLNSADNIVLFASTSKITYASAGLAFVGGSSTTLNSFRRRLSMMTIGPDKVNQLRHMRFLKDLDGIRAVMRGHQGVLQPKFAAVQQHLRDGLGNLGLAHWTDPAGGYFVSVDTKPGLAKTVVQLAADAGVMLTPAGAAFPYGRDPQDCNIRLAPSYPPLADVSRAMQVFVTCVKLASIRRQLQA